ncbi:MAG: tetratricopeptide repeat protein [Planctomycetes bacterium]|nr:tetratricopeptide repeat protein [Planctomycetota bacterium]
MPKSRAALFLFALLAALPPAHALRAEAEKDPLSEQAIAMANQGKFDDAVALLRAEAGKGPATVRQSILLGRLLDHIGKADEACAAWEKNLRKNADDYPLLMEIGRIRARQGDDGPNVSYDRGAVSYSPSKDEAKEEEYKQKHLRMAADAYARAMEAAPARSEPHSRCAEVLLKLKDFDGAAKLYENLLANDEKDTYARYELVKTLDAAGKKDQAAQHADKLLEANPRHAGGHAYQAARYRAQGDQAKAEAHRKMAGFYEWLAPFATMTYSDERYATYRLLARDGHNEGEEQQTPEKREKTAKARVDKVDALIAGGSKEDLEFLGTICLHHADHGYLEDRIYGAFAKRGQAAAAILAEVLRAAESTCTMKSAAFALAEIKAPEAFELIVRLLPGDLRSVWYVDAAGALAKLGDPRAVEPLIEALAPDLTEPPPPEDDIMGQSRGRRAARWRAALALGSFNTEASKKALDEGAKNGQIAAACHAALYRLTKDDKHLAPAKAVLDKDEEIGCWFVATFFRTMDDPKAKAAGDAWFKAREEERSKEEAEEKANDGK